MEWGAGDKVRNQEAEEKELVGEGGGYKKGTS